MDKEQVVTFIQSQIAAGKISKSDLLALAGSTGSQSPVNIGGNSMVGESPKNLTHIFYYIGAIIAVIGVVILIAQNWNDIGLMGRLAVTVGISFATYVAGYLFKTQRALSQVMFTIAAAVAPVGAYVLADSLNADFDLNAQIVAALVLFVIFGAAWFVTKRNILVLLTIGFATWAYYACIIKVFEVSYLDFDLMKWATIILGVAYLFIAYGYQNAMVAEAEDKEKNAVQKLLYALGTLGILSAGIAVGGIFDLVFIALVFGAFYLSVFVKNRLVLILGALFLMGHIIKITSKYFADSVGWPVALIAIGFLVIGVGYGTFYLNKKFISTK